MPDGVQSGAETRQCFMCEDEFMEGGFMVSRMITGPDELPDEQWLCDDCFDNLGEKP